jgi:tRNA (cmo5U34)-methyltransferase
MSEFDSRAREWDKDKMHTERSVAIAAALSEMIPLNGSMKALEFGAGTGILSFLLKDRFSEITLMDNSSEMIKVCEEKVECHKASHLKPVCFDLEHSDYASSFDVIFSQMVLHHIDDISSILAKFYRMLHPGGYLAIADLFTEDGSFHGPGVNVHLGFEPEILKEMLVSIGYKNIEFRTCFEIKREPEMKFPVFLLVAKNNQGII